MSPDTATWPPEGQQRPLFCPDPVVSATCPPCPGGRGLWGEEAPTLALTVFSLNRLRGTSRASSSPPPAVRGLRLVPPPGAASSPRPSSPPSSVPVLPSLKAHRLPPFPGAIPYSGPSASHHLFAPACCPLCPAGDLCQDRSCLHQLRAPGRPRPSPLAPNSIIRPLVAADVVLH